MSPITILGYASEIISTFSEGKFSSLSRNLSRFSWNTVVNSILFTLAVRSFAEKKAIAPKFSPLVSF